MHVQHRRKTPRVNAQHVTCVRYAEVSKETYLHVKRGLFTLARVRDVQTPHARAHVYNHMHSQAASVCGSMRKCRAQERVSVRAKAWDAATSCGEGLRTAAQALANEGYSDATGSAEPPGVDR